ncbi:MAG: response regulator [Bdellovibrionia bacterium]
MIKHTILCVDDEIDNVEALERLFRRKYNILKATSAKEALNILDQHPEPISLIISDQRMPEMTGVELFAKTLQSHPKTIRILLTGYTDLESIIMAVNEGQIYRYLTKPWEPIDLQNTVEHAIERYTLGLELEEKNQKLEEANAELKTLDQAKSNFMILINHELKTPLTSILSFSALLAESQLNDEDKLMVNRIQKSANRLKALIDDALLIVRAETNQLKLDINSVILDHLDEIITPEIQQGLAQKKQKIISRLEPVAVRADIRLIKQIILRLVQNATKFAAENSEIIVESTRTDNSLRFSVSNTGPHISQKVINKILKPFFIDEDVMNHSAGVGLGLTICQSILKGHQSSLDIKNTDQGVMVTFDLPLVSGN